MLKAHETLLPLPHTPSRHRARECVQGYINIIKFYPTYLSCHFGTGDQEDAAIHRLAFRLFVEEITGPKLISDTS